ncbi:LamG domain-containing protein [Promethearchaeum syntrophicum]|uniref:LamG domain-containing protein n=1 Tax=Promethearchaeum syntrophicum TaxID=2594042 RepID=A0A5B9DCI9_9ARCH|nr:LamG domain-containing protein [Candidatus Prometheoarchaeum syntrophicum]QEE16416.1 hypothetical protein DSAG12_02246 [Candidatus Prometheoarchaeum syntrophicum]
MSKIKQKLLIFSALILISFSSIISSNQVQDPKGENIPIAADINTVLHCGFEESIDSSTGETGVTNGNWEYDTNNPINETSSVKLAGDNQNSIKWNYGSALAEGTIECLFQIINLDSIDFVAQILQAGSNNNWHLAVYVNPGGALSCMITDEYGSHGFGGGSIISGKTYHVAATWGSRGLELWLNGVLVGFSLALTMGLEIDTPYYGIGEIAGESLNVHSVYGYFDEFRLSNIQRSTFPNIDDVIGAVPAAPTLDPISSPDEDGNIPISWSAVNGVSGYEIYRSLYPITEINSTHTLLDSTTQLTYEDFNLDNDTYYYSIVAKNASGASIPSNFESVLVSIPPIPEEITLLYCGFEGTIDSSTGETGITNGNWEYDTINPIIGSSSVKLAGENRNNIKWDYGSTLSDGTMECLFQLINLDSIDGAKYILEAGDYYNSSSGVYFYKNGSLYAQFRVEGTMHIIESTTNITSGETYHVALTWGTRGIQLWLNGEIVAYDLAITDGMESWTQYYGIGDTPMGSTNQSGYGYWDEFHLSNIQRSTFPNIGDVYTNGTWQDLVEGINTVQCIDQSDKIWMLVTVASCEKSQIKLTYFDSNPTSINEPNNLDLNYFYLLEVENISKIQSVSVTFYFGDANLSSDQLSTMCMYQYNISNWFEPNKDQRKEVNSIFIIGIELNTYYALGNDLSPETSTFNIPGYDLPIMFGFMAIVIVFLIQYRGKFKK